MPKYSFLVLLSTIVPLTLACNIVGSGSGAFDQQFIDMMVPHHQAAVEMAKVAQQRGEHPEVKDMAGAIVRAQEDEIGQMRNWRKSWFGSDETPPMSRMPMVPGTAG